MLRSSMVDNYYSNIENSLFIYFLGWLKFTNLWITFTTKKVFIFIFGCNFCNISPIFSSYLNWKVAVMVLNQTNWFSRIWFVGHVKKEQWYTSYEDCGPVLISVMQVWCVIAKLYNSCNTIIIHRESPRQRKIIINGLPRTRNTS